MPVGLERRLRIIQVISEADLARVAWYDANSNKATHPVGSRDFISLAYLQIPFLHALFPNTSDMRIPEEYLPCHAFQRANNMSFRKTPRSTD